MPFFSSSRRSIRSMNRRSWSAATTPSAILHSLQTNALTKKGDPLPSRPFILKTERSLLELDGAAGILDLLLDLLGLFLVDAFLDGLRSAFDQRLRLAEAKAGDRADFLDHVDLLAAVAGENDVELGLLFGSRSGSAAGGSSRARNRDRSRGRDAPLLFERLGEIRGLEDGQFGKLVDQLGDVSHFSTPCGTAPRLSCVDEKTCRLRGLRPC